MTPATLQIRRLTGKRGEGGVFTFVTFHTPDGDTYRSVHLGAERATCGKCGRGKSNCEHIRAVRALVASEVQ